MNVKDTKKGPCGPCLKAKEVLIFLVECESHKGWVCERHMAALLEQEAHQDRKDQPNGAA
jgi:hypothetical protein